MKRSVYSYLKRNGYDSKLDIWAPHELKSFHLTKCTNIFDFWHIEKSVYNHLKQFGAVSKLDIWIPQELKSIHLMKHINIYSIHC